MTDLVNTGTRHGLSIGLAGTSLALILAIFIVGPEKLFAQAVSAFGNTMIGDVGTLGIIALSAAAFVLSLRQRSLLVSGLLIATGALFLLTPTRAMQHFSSQGTMEVIHVGSFGVAILGLGVAKAIASVRTPAMKNIKHLE